MCAALRGRCAAAAAPTAAVTDSATAAETRSAARAPDDDGVDDHGHLERVAQRQLPRRRVHMNEGSVAVIGAANMNVRARMRLCGRVNQAQMSVHMVIE